MVLAYAFEILWWRKELWTSDLADSNFRGAELLNILLL